MASWPHFKCQKVAGWSVCSVQIWCKPPSKVRGQTSLHPAGVILPLSPCVRERCRHLTTHFLWCGRKGSARRPKARPSDSSQQEDGAEEEERESWLQSNNRSGGVQGVKRRGQDKEIHWRTGKEQKKVKCEKKTHGETKCWSLCKHLTHLIHLSILTTTVLIWRVDILCVYMCVYVCWCASKATSAFISADFYWNIQLLRFDITMFTMIVKLKYMNKTLFYWRFVMLSRDKTLFFKLTCQHKHTL